MSLDALCLGLRLPSGQGCPLLRPPVIEGAATLGLPQPSSSCPTDPLHATLTPKKLKTGIGSTVILSCALSGSPEYTLRWYRNTELVGPDDFISIRGINNETLLITAAQKSHSGAYQCFATRKAQTAQDFAIIVLEGELSELAEGAALGVCGIKVDRVPWALLPSFLPG